VVTSNRINTPEVAEEVLARGDADMVSLARPFLADAEFVAKAAQGRAEEINTCIACNQACLDHIFANQMTSCLVNPRACHETEIVISPALARKRVAVVGAGPAGLSAAVTLAERGHEVHLYEAADRIGGQFNMARRIPGKEEFDETLRYFARRLQRTGVRLHLNTRMQARDLVDAGFDEVVLASGVSPRDPAIPGQDHPQVLSYVDVLRHGRPVGARVAIVGSGGIGFDVAEYLSHGADLGHPSPSLDRQAWQREWGVTDPEVERGGVVRARPEPAARRVTMLQRKPGKPGAGLGKTTGWIHRAALKARHVEMLAGVNYERIGGVDGALGLFVSFGKERRGATVLEVDTVVLCAGQEPLRELQAPLEAAGLKVHLVGGALEARELDAKLAIEQGLRAGIAI
jgi:2,4-dienoyl-CoA reductase (NADPH2)